MLLTFEKSKQVFLLALVLLSLGACKQSEFYDKAALLDPAKSAKENPGPDTGVDPTNDPTVTSGGNNPGSNPTLPDVGTSPTENPPVLNPPVTTLPPVIVTPPTVGPSPAPCSGLSCITLIDRSEIFTQKSNRNGDVDILWVMDDSGSMADNQTALANNFDKFITQFLTEQIDFKMAITTTDATINHNGKMVGDSSKLTSASANGNQTAFSNNFTKWIKVGTSGSGVEQGLKCAASFFDRYASSFLRADAYLAIVFVSDEEDQSDKAVSDYINKFQALKSNKGMVKAYSIVTTKMPKNAQYETIGNRYINVSKATSGLYSEITNDFASTLLNIGGNIVSLVDQFPLAEAPYNNLINVYVNNVQVKTGWTFDNVSHTLKFDSNSLPVEGAKIEVRYKVQATVLGAI